jgi:hypothetical protein
MSSGVTKGKRIFPALLIFLPYMFKFKLARAQWRHPEE